MNPHRLNANQRMLRWRIPNLVRVFLGLLVLGATAGPSLSLGESVAAQPLKIDLNTFDAMKKTIALPNGQSLAYLEMGNLSGTPVVMIHGYTDSARNWVPMLPYVSKQFHLILVDIRGHG
jgi:hypothetical protein